MPMLNANVVSVAFDNEYKHLSQQEDSRVQSVVRNKMFKGEYLTDDYINTIAVSDVVTGRATGSATVTKDIGFSRRRLFAATQTWSTPKADKDVAEMQQDPTSQIVREMVQVMNRKRDQSVIAAMTSNVDVYNSGTLSWDSTAFPSEQIIAANNSGMTVEKLLDAKQKMDAAEVDPSGRCVVHNSFHMRSLLNETKATSQDFVQVNALVHGDIDTFLGFKFIHSELVGSLATDSALAFQKDKVVFGYNMTPKTRITENDSINYDWTLFVEEQFGAIRGEDVAVVEMEMIVPV